MVTEEAQFLPPGFSALRHHFFDPFIPPGPPPETPPARFDPSLPPVLQPPPPAPPPRPRTLTPTALFRGFNRVRAGLSILFGKRKNAILPEVVIYIYIYILYVVYILRVYIILLHFTGPPVPLAARMHSPQYYVVYICM